jgi:DNA-binding protein WhiA
LSFTDIVKEELENVPSKALHCKKAEIAGAFSLSGIELAENGVNTVILSTDREGVLRKFFTLLRKTYNIMADTSDRRNHKTVKSRYELCIKDCHLTDFITADTSGNCCKRAWIRGAFLAAGYINEPEKPYHFEIVCDSLEKASFLRELFDTFSISAKTAARKKAFIVYIKDGAGIADALKVMGAHIALLEFENVRIIKEMRGSVNRKVNCETANIRKTVSAAMKQTEDAILLRETIGLSALPQGLSEMALIRLENPDATLSELGTLMKTPIGKSGVNHRLRKLSKLADKVRQGGDYD